MITHPLFAALTSSATPATHPMGAWTMGAILSICFLGILGGAIAITTFLDRHRQAGTDRARQTPEKGQHHRL